MSIQTTNVGKNSSNIQTLLKSCMEAVENAPNSAQKQANLGSVYAMLQQWESAIICYQKAISINPKFAGAYRNLAKIFNAVNQPEAATDCYYQALIIEPNSASAETFLSLGDSLLQNKKQIQAINCYQQALKLKSNWGEAYYGLAEVYSQQKKWSEAWKNYQQAIKYLPNSSDTLTLGIKHYYQTLKDNPQASSKDYFNLGMSLKKYSYFTETIYCLLKAIELQPNFHQAYIALQYTTIDDKNLQLLVESYKNIIQKQPNNFLAWGNLGDCLTLENQVEKAIQCYKKGAYLKSISQYPYLSNRQWKDKKELPPDFLIIGAAKAGTTSLYAYLGQHPQVLYPHKKELNFFSGKFGHGVDWYLSQFPSLSDESEFITGEATPNYFEQPDAPQRIFQLFPNIKLILLLRNPIDRAISWHNHMINRGIEKRDLLEALDIELEKINNYNEQQLFSIGRHSPNNLLGSLYFYRLLRWLDKFSREQLLIIKSEDFYNNPAIMMPEIFNFLGISEHLLGNYPQCNSGSYSKIDDKLRQKLQDFFAPYNQKLEAYLGINFNWN